MNINGLDVDVVRKNNKNMHLYVLPPDGAVRVSVPYRLDDEAIRLFVLTKMGWIKRQIDKYKNQLRQSEREYVTGESHYLWGRRYQLKIVEATRTKGLFIQSDILMLIVRSPTTREQCETIFNEWYRKELKTRIPQFINLWQQRLGVCASSWHVKNMRTKWGTCNVRNKRLWFNLQLAKKPIECLEYIIVHELCHLLQKNHSPAFVALMDKHLPGWQATRKQLNEFVMDAYNL